MHYNEFLFRDPGTNTVSDVSDRAHFPAAPTFNANLAVEYAFPETGAR